jgi:hypothetical protein
VERRLFAELAHNIFNSPSYGAADETDVLWRTAVCEREAGTTRRAPNEYAQYARNYHQMCAMCYEAGGREKQAARFMREVEACEELNAYMQSDPPGRPLRHDVFYLPPLGG